LDVSHTFENFAYTLRILFQTLFGYALGKLTRDCLVKHKVRSVNHFTSLCGNEELRSFDCNFHKISVASSRDKHWVGKVNEDVDSCFIPSRDSKEILYTLRINLTGENESNRANISGHIQLRERNLNRDTSTALIIRGICKESGSRRRLPIIDEIRNFHLLVEVHRKGSVSANSVSPLSNLDRLLKDWYFSGSWIVCRLWGWDIYTCKDLVHKLRRSNVLPFGSFCSNFNLTFFKL